MDDSRHRSRSLFERDFIIFFIFRLRRGGFGQAATLTTFHCCLLAWSRLFLSPSHSKRCPTPPPTSRCRRPSLNTRAGEAWRRMRTRSTTPADIKPGQIPACGGCLNWDQTLHFFSGCIESVFLFFFPIWGPNAANCCQWQQKWLLKRLCLISYNLLTSSELRCPTNHRGGRQQHACRTSVPLLCIKDETRWQITVARAALNPSIVFQSCCPVICSRRLASASVFGLFNASFTESITFSHKNMTLRARARTCASAGGSEGRDGRGRGRAREIGMDGGMDGWAQWEA